MADWLRSDVTIKKLTAKLVEEFVGMERLPHDRELRGKRVDFLMKEVESDSFRTCEWASCFCKQTGKTYRINGKHTSTVFSQLSKLPNIPIVVERYSCDTLEQCAQLYGTFDSKESARTSSDINYTFAASVPELCDIPIRTLNICVSGMAYAILELNVTSETPLEKAARIPQEVPFLRWAAQFIRGGGSTSVSKIGMNRSPVAAAMYKTFHANTNLATEFWTLVVEESSSLASCPTRKLARSLVTTSVRGSSRIRKSTGNHEMMVKCIHAWNAWCTGEETRLAYHPEAATPAVCTKNVKP